MSNKNNKEMERELVNHTESMNSTYGFNLLNDRQKADLCGKEDFLHCSINEDGKGGKMLLKDGSLKSFSLLMTKVVFS